MAADSGDAEDSEFDGGDGDAVVPLLTAYRGYRGGGEASFLDEGGIGMCGADEGGKRVARIPSSSNTLQGYGKPIWRSLLFRNT